MNTEPRPLVEPLTTEQLFEELTERTCEAQPAGYRLMTYPDAAKPLDVYRGNQTWLEVAIELEPEVMVAPLRESHLYVAYAPEKDTSADNRVSLLGRFTAMITGKR